MNYNKYLLISLIISINLFTGCNSITMLLTGDDYYQSITVTGGDTIIHAYIIPKKIIIKIDESIDYYWYKPNEIKHNKGGYFGNLLHGKYLIFDRQNNMLVEGYFKKGIKSDKWKRWYTNGELKETCEYKNGKKDGTYKKYTSSGELTVIKNYKKDLLHGKVQHFSQDTIYNDIYKQGVKIKKEKKTFFLIRWFKNLFKK